MYYKSSDSFFFNFSKYVSELSTFISASLKSIMSIQLAAQYAGQILSLECYANGFVKIVQEYRGIISYLKGYFYSKLRNLSKQKPRANTVSTKRTTLW